MTKIKPAHNNLLIKVAPEKEKTDGGLYIPTQAQEKQQQGEVVAVGPGKLSKDNVVLSMFCSPGNRVLFEKHRGTEITVDGEDFLILSEDFVLAVMC